MKIPRKDTVNSLIKMVDSHSSSQKSDVQYKGKKIEIVKSEDRLDSFFKESNCFATGVVVQATYMIVVAAVTLVTATIGGGVSNSCTNLTGSSNESLDVKALLDLRKSLI